MDEDCLILGSFSKNRKLDDTINICDEESVLGSKRIVNPFKKNSKHKSSGNPKSCSEKKKKTVKSTNVASTNITTNFLATSAGYSYSISETEIHHLQDGRTIASRGVNTDPNPNILTCCCACGSTDPSGTQVSNDFHNNLSHRKLSNEILELSNGLVLNELQNMGEVNMAQSLKPSVPDDYIDLKGKGKINTL